MHLALLVAAMAVASPDVTSTALIELVGDVGDGDRTSARAIALEVRALLGADPRLSLQTPEVTARFVDAAKGLGVDCDPLIDECLLQLAGVCGVAQALHGHVDGTRLTLRNAVVDGGHVHTTTVRVTPRPDVRDAELREALAVLLRPADVAGLTVDAPAGSTVSVDGVERGRAPFAAVGLPAGHHIVEVRFADDEQTTRTVTLTAGRRARALLLPRPLGAKVTQWSGGALVVAASAAAVVAAIGGVVYNVEGSMLAQQADSYVSHPLPGDPKQAADFNDVDERQKAIGGRDLQAGFGSVVLPALLVAAGTGAAGVAALLLGDWGAEIVDPAPEDGPL